MGLGSTGVRSGAFMSPLPSPPRSSGKILRPVAAQSALFVYGTLMPGQSRWPLLQPYAVTSEPAYAQGRLWDTGSGFPAARFDRTGGGIPGVRVTIAPDRFAGVLAVLDRVEGEGRLFRRVEVMTSAGPAAGYEWMGPTDAMTPLLEGWPAKIPS
jgi:gamma-glutamylcyclotransferase (GGCT)/AIG2-like uncharacterized protein YtfP